MPRTNPQTNNPESAAFYFGVRHFSPACAQYITGFLERIQPDIVLIEGPSDRSDLIPVLCQEDVTLPAALLAYTEESPVRTVLWPFADFSPEYRAMRWAASHGIPVQFCDLPSDCLLALQNDKPEDEQQESAQDENTGELPEQESVYAALERQTGLDHETFWEYTFEQCRTYEEFEAAMTEYSRSLRELSESDEHNDLRESFMRVCIAEAAKTHRRVAVVTGAFHTPALRDNPCTKADEKAASKLKTTKARATLMPYSYYRLSSRAGYGAGSKAPGYFEILWNCRCDGDPLRSGAEYLARLASFQRKAGNTASAAEVIEALRLANTLSAMRGGRAPAFSDLRDAAVTCMGHGDFSELSLACADVEIGTKIGSLPEGAVCTSVQEDFIRQIKELKLERYRTATAQEADLDLRENIRVKTEKSAFLDLNRSALLHRLLALGVHFAKQLYREQDNATWAEKWEFRWTPETEIELVEASLRGDTIEQAAVQALNFKLMQAQTLSETAEILSEAFRCRLEGCVRSAVSAVQAMATECASAAAAGKTTGTLSHIARFGNIRRIDCSPLEPLISQLYLKFCLQLSPAANCDRAAAEQILPALTAVSEAVTAHDFLDSERFTALLRDLAENDFANPLISGFACTMLTEQGAISTEDFSALLNRRLSAGTPPAEAAAWFEGLAKRNRRALISRLSVWEKLSALIASLSPEEFKPVLVVLRRTFAEFSPTEKSDIAENIGEVLGISTLAAAEEILEDFTVEEQEAISELDDFDFDDF